MNLIPASLSPAYLLSLCLHFMRLLVNQINKHHAKLLESIETETLNRTWIGKKIKERVLLSSHLLYYLN